MTKPERLTWHPCPGIEPDMRTFGYVCVNCGRQLKEWGKWFRHTNLNREGTMHGR